MNEPITSEQALVTYAWRTKDVYLLCRYYFDFHLTKRQETIVSIAAFDGYWENKAWVEAKLASICCTTRYGKSRSVALGLLLWIAHCSAKVKLSNRLRLIAPKDEKTAIIREYMIEHILNSPYFTWLLDIDKSGEDRIKKAVNRKRMTWRNGVDFRTLSADKSGKGEGLMGWGGDKIVVEEAGEMPAVIWPKIQRMMLDNKDSSYMEIGNPWNRDGFFWEHWINPEFVHIHIDWRVAVQEGRFTQEQIDSIRKDPLTTPLDFQVLYDAVFPEESENQLIPYHKIQKAIRPIPLNLPSPDDRRLGADVAEFGVDLTVQIGGFRCGKLLVAKEIREHAKQELMETVDKIMQFNDKMRFDIITPDSTGIGAGVTSRLKQLKEEDKLQAKICPFKGAEKPKQLKAAEIYRNIKAQAYYHLRNLFIEENIIIPNHRVLVDQLTKMKWKRDSQLKIVVLDPGEAKDDTAEKKSPDFADALCYFAWGDYNATIVG